MSAFTQAFHALPVGYFTGTSQGRRWRVNRQAVAGGRGWKLQAWEEGGGDYVSLNLYELAAGPLLKPCEMPEAKVVAFILDLRPGAAATPAG